MTAFFVFLPLYRAILFILENIVVNEESYRIQHLRRFNITALG